jgi:hypothetical protein
MRDFHAKRIGPKKWVSDFITLAQNGRKRGSKQPVFENVQVVLLEGSWKNVLFSGGSFANPRK